MSLRSDAYIVKYNEKNIGNYYINDDNSVFFSLDWGSPWDIEEELKVLGLHKEYKGKKPPAIFPEIINDENRVPGRKRIIYHKGLLTLERQPKETGERFSVYRRSANKGAADYSPLPHDAPHYEGEKTRRKCGNGVRGTLLTKWTTVHIKQSLMKRGVGAAVTMTAALYGVRFRRNG